MPLRGDHKMHIDQYKIILKTSEEDDGANTTFYTQCADNEDAYNEMKARYRGLSNTTIMVISMVQKDGD